LNSQADESGALWDDCVAETAETVDAIGDAGGDSRDSWPVLLEDLLSVGVELALKDRRSQPSLLEAELKPADAGEERCDHLKSPGPGLSAGVMFAAGTWIGGRCLARCAPTRGPTCPVAATGHPGPIL